MAIPQQSTAASFSNNYPIYNEHVQCTVFLLQMTVFTVLVCMYVIGSGWRVRDSGNSLRHNVSAVRRAADGCLARGSVADACRQCRAMTARVIVPVW